MLSRRLLTAALLCPLLISAVSAQVLTETSPADSGSDVETASGQASFIEVILSGDRVQIPIVEGEPAEIEIDGRKWQLQPSPPATAESTTPSTQSPTENLDPQTQPVKLPPAAAEPAAADPPPVNAWEAVLNWWNSRPIETKGMIVALAGVVVYFMIIVPMIRRRPLKAALKIIRQDQRPQFTRAEDLLGQALLAGLWKKDIAHARFALGYLRARLGKLEEASTVLAELEQSKASIDGATAYLNLWVQSKLNNHERVERIYNENQKRLKDRHQTKFIVSMSYLALARLKWARREINGAMHYFDEVRKLEELADEIPSHIDDHEVVVGTMSLFERNPEEARKHFDAAIRAAEERGKPTHPGQLGLLLCKWREERIPLIDDELGEILRHMKTTAEDDDSTPLDTECTHCGKAYRVRSSYLEKKVQCRGCRRKFVVEEAAPPAVEDQEATEPDPTDSVTHDQLLNDEELLLRNTRLWHCMSLLMTWRDRPEGSGLKEQDLPTFRKRVKRVTDLDPEFGDGDLILGLIRYYFATSESDRKAGRSLIAKAVDKDVHVPEVLQLMDRENKLAALAQNSLGYFHQLARQYAENGEVDPQLRSRFLQHMNRFRRFRDLGDVELNEAGNSRAPSLENLQGRGQILRSRLANIVRHRLTDEDEDIREGIQGGLDELQQHADVLNHGVKAFQQTELTLMESTGEFLFEDEEPLETDGSTDHEDSNGESNANED